MIVISGIDDSSKEMVSSFLKGVPSIEKIDDNILDNACYAKEDERIVGCISFEIFGKKGLIRYFVFKKILDDGVLNDLLKKLEEKAIDQGIKMFVCIAENYQIEELFKTLGFNKVENDLFFINEDNIKNTNFKNSSFLSKLLTY